MSTLQQDLDDFGPALVESKYDYNSKDYMRTHGLTNNIPGSKSHSSKQDKRNQNINQRRVRRKDKNSTSSQH